MRWNFLKIRGGFVLCCISEGELFYYTSSIVEHPEYTRWVEVWSKDIDQSYKFKLLEAEEAMDYYKKAMAHSKSLLHIIYQPI